MNIRIYEEYVDGLNDEYRRFVREGSRRDLSITDRMDIRQKLTNLRRKKKRWKHILIQLY